MFGPRVQPSQTTTVRGIIEIKFLQFIGVILRRNFCVSVISLRTAVKAVLCGPKNLRVLAFCECESNKTNRNDLLRPL